MIDRSIWSDETEMLAKIAAMIQMKLSGKFIKWELLLPERYQAGTQVSTIPNADEMKQITRSLSAQLDALAKTMK